MRELDARCVVIDVMWVVWFLAFNSANLLTASLCCYSTIPAVAGSQGRWDRALQDPRRYGIRSAQAGRL